MLVLQLLKYRQWMFSQPIKGVMYCNTEMQKAFEHAEGVTFFYGMPTQEEVNKFSQQFGGHMLLIFDDLMLESANSDFIQSMVTRESHHKQISCIFINQNIFMQGKSARNQALNSHYYLLAQNLHDQHQLSDFGGRLFPGKGRQFLAIFRDATDNPLQGGPDAPPGHLLLCCHPKATRSP